MRLFLSAQDIKIIREMVDYEELHARKLSEWEEKYEAPQLQQNIIKYIAKKTLARRVDFIVSLKEGVNELTTEQCSNLARSLESKLERDVKATHRLYNRVDGEGTLTHLAKEELIPTFMLLDQLRDY